jgi:hypothetical protein
VVVVVVVDDVVLVDVEVDDVEVGDVVLDAAGFVLDAVVPVTSVDTVSGEVAATGPADEAAGAASSDESPPLSVVGLHPSNAGTSAASQILRRRATTPTVPNVVARVMSRHQGDDATVDTGTFVGAAVSEEHQTGRRCTLPT